MAPSCGPPPSGRAPGKSLSDFEIAQERDLERRALLREAGLDEEGPEHYRRPEEQPFTRAERDRVTLLFGGLTQRHDRLICAAVKGLGYRVQQLPTPTKADYQTGREYGNNGQCNPTYFTVGCLLNYLKQLRDEQGLSPEEIARDYVYVTAGACGPCRFGMYEEEFRLALRNSGFENFRVLTFQQRGGMKQSAADVGLVLDVEFGLRFVGAVIMGDLLNALGHQLRPYEIAPGSVDRVLEQATAQLEAQLVRMQPARPRLAARAVAALFAPAARREDAARIADEALAQQWARMLAGCREMIEAGVRVDFTRPKPMCKITGEFWAQTTEGDGNYGMFDFLEGQSAEVLVEPVTTWLAYMLALERSRLLERRGLDSGRGFKVRLRAWRVFWSKRVRLYLAGRLLARAYDGARAALGGTTHPQVCQLELQRLGHPYYAQQCTGGEGHLEVAKNIYYHNRRLAHMVMSLKPFGCMPSTQSDGAQAAVTAHYPDMIFIPIETSGEGDVNAYSRAQMALGEARACCYSEFRECLQRTGYALEEIRAYCRVHEELRSPLLRVPKEEGVVGRAANFVLYVGRLMDEDQRRHARAPDTAPAAATAS